MKKGEEIYNFLILILILLLNICLLLMFMSSEASARYKFERCSEVGCPDIGNILCATIIVREGGTSYGIACYQTEFNF